MAKSELDMVTGVAWFFDLNVELAEQWIAL